MARRNTSGSFTVIPDSHLDHGLSKRHLRWLRKRFGGCKGGVVVQTLRMPRRLTPLKNALYGPAAGDAPVPESSVYSTKRGVRSWTSRMVARPTRPTREVTVIAGPDGGRSCVLYTAFGGSSTPRESGDPDNPDKAPSKAFWAKHALSDEA